MHLLCRWEVIERIGLVVTLRCRVCDRTRVRVLRAERQEWRCEALRATLPPDHPRAGVSGWGETHRGSQAHRTEHSYGF